MDRRDTLSAVRSSGPLAALGAAFLLGGLLGSLAAALMTGQTAQGLADYLRDYLALARDGRLQTQLWPLAWEQLRFLLGAAALGCTALGVAGIPALFGARGFLLAFSVGGLCRVFGPAGLGPALVLFGLPAFLWAPLLFLAGEQSLGGSWALLRRLAGDGRAPLPFGSGYWLRLALWAGALLACVVLEHSAAPVLLKAAARLVL